jgi:hypothetical protein
MAGETQATEATQVYIVIATAPGQETAYYGPFANRSKARAYAEFWTNSKTVRAGVYELTEPV